MINARKIQVVTLIVVAVVGIGWWLTPPPLAGVTDIVEIPVDVDAWLAASEGTASAEYELIPGTDKRIRWQQPGIRTPKAIVYLHGFSATRQEIAPTAELVADRIGANLFETRLSGHGHGRLPMHEVRAEHWLHDGVEAIQIGALLGDEVIIISTSTGSTLALALADHPVMHQVSTLVLISPNVAPADPKAAWLTRPAGPLIARLIAGDTRSWKAHNDLQERFWSTSYPSDATVEVMRLVDRAESLAGMPMKQSVLMMLSPADTVISPAAARAAYNAFNVPRKVLIEVSDSGDPSNHILAGDILSPHTTGRVAEQIVRFLTVQGQ